MTKYKYLCFCELNSKGQNLTDDEWKEYFAKEDKAAEKHGVDVLFRGSAFGVIESILSVYESEKPIDVLSAIFQEAGRRQYVSAARTLTIVPF